MVIKIEEAIKQKKFRTNYDKALVNIIYTSNWFRDKHASLLKPYSLLLQHYNVLRILHGKYPEVASPSDIKEVMLDKGNDLTRLLDKLVKMEYVERNLCPSNRRKMDLKITEKGIKILEEMSLVWDEEFKQVFNNLTDAEADMLSHLLDKLRQE